MLRNRIPVDVDPGLYQSIKAGADTVAINEDEFRRPIGAILDKKLELLGLASVIREGRIVIVARPSVERKSEE